MPIYLQQDGASAGPFDEGAVRARLTQGTLTADVYAWREGLSHWQPLGELLAAAAPPPSFHVPAPGAAAAQRARLPWWGKTLLGCGGLAFVLFVALVLLVVHVNREEERNRSPADREMSAQRAKREKAWEDVQAEIERDMADPEHYTTIKANNADGSTTTIITPKGNVPGRHPITKRVDADGEITASWIDAEGNSIKRTQDKLGNVQTTTTQPQ